MGIHSVLEDVMAAAVSEKAKGEALERLIKVYLSQDQAWTGRFDAVWLWDEWPGRDGKPDTGIDLVARERDTGNLWAIQSKFYAPEHTLQKSDIDSFFTASGKSGFTNRILVSTTDKWSKNAEAALDGQQIPVTRLRLADLAESTIDWESYHPAKSDDVQQRPRKTPRPHQQLAISKVTEGLKALDRGKLIMACGTGKTFTSLQIAQEMVGRGGTVLFLVPSISLLQQTLREWTAEAGVPLRSFAVCSDTKVGKKAEDISVHDLMYPATTDPAKLAKAMAATASAEAMTVVFSTYQSLPVVAAAQQAGLSEFDLVICDEAHRTTGVTLADDDDSNFVRIHDNDYLKAARRLYMTATPRIFNDSSKSKAADAGAEVTSMDDEVTFGPELHRLGFGEAVGKGLLADYKVLVLAVDEKFVSRIFQAQLADDNHELRLDDAAKIIGCWNGLAKQRALGVDPDLGSDGQDADPEPMRRAVAFAKSIKDSQRIADLFGGIVAEYTAGAADDDPLQCSVQHVDGTFNVLERSSRLDWLKDDSDGNTCRILTNARCLSEGVDVPALDAVIFLNPRNSIVDVVQSVGRVMRRHEGKEYGYVILPVGIPAGLAPEEALADNSNFKVVWQVLNALRAHDDRFDATVNKIDLNRGSSSAIQIIGVSGPSDEDDDGTDAQRSWQAQTIPFPQIEQWRDAIYAKIVAKVGDRRYWEDWAGDIAKIAERHVTRITAILDDPDTAAAQEFESFLSGLRGNLNESITRVDAIDMLAQHLITKPVFDALFEGYSFAQHNPVSQVMQRMLDALDEHALEKESATLDAFYESVRMRAAGIDNAAGKQRIVTELYEKFFKLAFPKMADKLGIVYTPIEVVDYIINSVQHVLQTEFDSDLNDADVHVLDPFTGTGTFIVRLLESGLITPDNLARKYASELHANEIVLLAYYIAAINIEATYHAVHGGPYQPFDGIVLADTFQMYEHGDRDDFDVFPENNERVIAQKKAPIRVILGNPPYSVGQSSQNDSNQNLPYPTLDSRIEGTYAAASSAGLKRNLYDSYVRAFRWASDRIGDHGVVAFVTNGAWLDNNAFDGFRKSLADEFAGIWVFNLRGNQRTSGETSRKEGGKVFGQGSRTPVAITVLIKKADQAGPAAIHYRDIGDYLTRDDKLSILGQAVSISSGSWETLPPNAAGDWINQRDETYETYQPLGAKKDASASPVFDLYSLGVVTNRDAWAINSSREVLLANMTRMVAYYNQQRVALGEWCHERSRPRDDAAVDAFTATVNDPAKISWTRGLKGDLRKDKAAVIDPHKIVTTMYRPYFKQRLYFDRQLNEVVGLIPRMFPTPDVGNLAISLNASDLRKPFSPIIVDCIPNLALSDPGQCFPMYSYESMSDDGGLFAEGDLVDGFIRKEAITDATLTRYRAAYGSEVTKEDIFFFVYGLLHSPDYVERYQADLRKMIPRIPLVKDFRGFSTAGRALAEWHLGYESVNPWPLEGLPGADAPAPMLRVEKMRWAKSGSATDRSKLIVNSHVTLSGIPEEALRYTLGGKSALDWLVDRYQVSQDKASGIVNDPNLYSEDPRYIVDLVARMVRVSVESVRIIEALPALEIIE